MRRLLCAFISLAAFCGGHVVSMPVIIAEDGAARRVLAPKFQMVAVSHAAQDAYAGFFPSVNDVPLIEGGVELVEETVVFDQPQGRVIELSALVGGRSPQQIEEFYQHTLPQLGWVMHGANIYKREGEMLRLNVTNSGRQQALLRLSIGPQ
jgi:hypothetical protein